MSALLSHCTMISSNTHWHHTVLWYQTHILTALNQGCHWHKFTQIWTKYYFISWNTFDKSWHFPMNWNPELWWKKLQKQYKIGCINSILPEHLWTLMRTNRNIYSQRFCLNFRWWDLFHYYLRAQHILFLSLIVHTFHNDSWNPIACLWFQIFHEGIIVSLALKEHQDP